MGTSGNQMAYEPDDVINGSSGELWINNERVQEVTAFEAKITAEKAEVLQTGSRSKGYKVIGLEGKGTIKINKISSRFIKLLSDDLKKGITTKATIVSKLDDPTVKGAERIKLSGCTFDELQLANWEVRKLGEESIPFSFTDWEIIENI